MKKKKDDCALEVIRINLDTESDIKPDLVNEYIKSKKEERCCVCNKATNLIEINYQAPFCGDECVGIMDKASVTGTRIPIIS